jgi:hypothetical protein
LLYPLSYQGSCGRVEGPLSCGFSSPCRWREASTRCNSICVPAATPSAARIDAFAGSLQRSLLAELNPVEGLWSTRKAIELANLTSLTLAEVIQQAHRGIDRVRRTPAPGLLVPAAHQPVVA